MHPDRLKSIKERAERARRHEAWDTDEGPGCIVPNAHIDWLVSEVERLRAVAAKTEGVG